jgi:hypothetical protein
MNQEGKHTYTRRLVISTREIEKLAVMWNTWYISVLSGTEHNSLQKRAVKREKLFRY